MAVDKVEFDILAHDRASSDLDHIAREFRKLSSEADDVGKHDGLSDLQKQLKAFSADVDRQAPKNAAQLDKIAAAYKRLGNETDVNKRNAGLDALSRQLHKITDDFETEGKGWGQRLGAGLKKWVTGDGQGLFKQIGQNGGTVFGSGFLGVLKTPVLGPLVVGAIGATVATVLPAVGAIAGSALVTGFGAGIAGLGIVFAAKSQAVQDKWKTTLTGMGKDLTLLSRPFEATLSNIATYAQRTFDNFKPALGKAFTNLAEPIDRFANDALHALDRFKPALDPIVTGTTQVLQSLGGALPGAIGNISDGFAQLARSVAANPHALADTVTGLGNLTRAVTDGLTTLNDLNGAIENMTGGFSAVDGVMAALSGTTGLLFGVFKGLDVIMDKLGLKNKEYQGAVDLTAQSQQMWTQGLNATQLAALGITPAMTAATGATKEQDKAAAEAAANTAKAKAATDAWIQSLFKLQGQALSLSGAQISYQASIDAATASIKANGKAHDINTEKGRANRTALDAVAKAANDQTEAMLSSGKGVRAASTSAANAQGNFVRLAEKMGYGHDEAVRLARSLVAIPKKTETDLKADITDLQNKIKSAKTKLADKDLTRERKAQIKANIADLQNKLRIAQGAINALHGKTVGVTIKYSTTGVNLTTPSSVGRRAEGGPVKAGEPYVVGEKRPELFVPEENGYIIPDPSKLGGAKGGTSAGAYAPMVAQGNVPHFTLGSDGSELGDLLMRVIRASMQRQGGNPALLGVSG